MNTRKLICKPTSHADPVHFNHYGGPFTLCIECGETITGPKKMEDEAKQIIDAVKKRRSEARRKLGI